MKNLYTTAYEPIEIQIRLINIERGFAQTNLESGTTGENFSDGGVF